MKKRITATLLLAAALATATAGEKVWETRTTDGEIEYTPLTATQKLTFNNENKTLTLHLKNNRYKENIVQASIKETTKADENKDATTEIYGADNKITIIFTDQMEREVTIADMKGRTIAKPKKISTGTFDTPGKGNYIVNIKGEKNIKIKIR